MYLFTWASHLIGFLFKSFKKPIRLNTSNLNITKRFVDPINRVKSKADKDWNGNPREYSIYGVITIKDLDMAIAHWQGWEDAGWRLIPVKELEPFRMPDLSRVEFYYTYPHTVRDFCPAKSNDGMLCRIVKYKLKDTTVYADIKFVYTNVKNSVPIEYLYDKKDPQYYK